MPRILVVDNDVDMRELIELALDGEGHDIDSVDSGQAALERLAQHAYDLVVCDLHMPDVDGRAIYPVETTLGPSGRPRACSRTPACSNTPSGDSRRLGRCSRRPCSGRREKRSLRRRSGSPNFRPPMVSTSTPWIGT